MSVNLESKNHLARLLATENIFIRHKKVKTASFDTVSRILTFPTWKEMTDALYTMLAGHEVGHALYTLRKRLDEIAKMIDPDHVAIAAAYVNIIEDVRIERLVKAMYSGLRLTFATAYEDLFNRNFFGTKDDDIQSRCFIDRANLYHKVGPHVSLQFTPEEQSMLDRMERTESSEDVIELTKEVYKWAQLNDQNPAPMEMELSKEDLEKLKEAIKNGDVELVEDDCEPGSGYGPSINIEMDGGDEGDGDSNDDDGKNGDGDDGESGESISDSKSKSKSRSGKGVSSQDNGEGEGEVSSEGKPSKDVKDGKAKKPIKTPNRKLKPVLPGPAPMPRTQQIYDENVAKLNDENASEIVYVNLPRPILKNIIVDYKVVHQEIRSHFMRGSGSDITLAEKAFNDFRQTNQDKINYLFTQFEMKKQADRYMRRKTNKTGAIDTLRLHAYKYEDDLFKSIATITDAKNHGLVFVIDWSQSMSGSIAGTVEQLINLCLFSRKAQIPFEVFSLTTGRGSEKSFEHKPGDMVYTNMFRMRNYLSSRMNAKEFTDACVNLFALIPNGSFTRSAPTPDNLIGCTPLDEAIITTIDLIKDLRARTKAQVVNAIFLTDGGANTVSQYLDDHGSNERMNYNGKYVIEDKLTRKHYEFSASYQAMTPVMLEILRDRMDIHAVGFHIIDADEMSEYFFRDVSENKKSIKSMQRQFKEDGYAICTSWGFNELYLIKGGDTLRVKDVELTPKKNGVPIKPGSPEYLDAVTGNLAKQGHSLRKQRLLLDRFIRMIA